ncbi:MAG: DUF4097 family beta strand repeat protein [Bacteroidetes bacterium]|jgi:hypothetical protein|nr:DUF4097 family beta strand repeat protein [Bacteroidota bacterium]
MACDDSSDDRGMEETDSGRLLLGSAEDRATLERGVELRGRTLVFDGQQGSIELRGTEAEAANLAFTKIGRGRNPADAEQVLSRIAVEEAGDDNVYQYMMRADEPELSRVEVDGTVPQTSTLNITMEAGQVVVDSVRGPVTVQSTNGSVTVTQAGAGMDVSTRNGSITVSLLSIAQDEEVRLETRNGDITLRLGPNIAADIDAMTESGEIATRGLPFEERALARDGAGFRFEGRVGNGGATIQLRTQNGTITLAGLEAAAAEDGPRPAEQQPFPEDLYPTDPAPPPAEDTVRTVPPDTTDTTQADPDTTGTAPEGR